MAVGDLGLNEGQRTEAIAALEKASAVGAEGGGSAKKAGQRGRQKDALGTTSHERVAAQGCPHCAGREVVGWGRSHGLLRFRCKSCGRTFNARGHQDADGASGARRRNGSITPGR